ncbi:MAG TPA: DinB family protein [Gemmatimonadaceae bacterium]
MLAPLVADLRRIYEGNAWHGPAVLDAIQNVTAAQAASRPIPGSHTIYELTHHIAAWMGETASRLQGNPPGMPADGDFPPRSFTVDDTTWSDLRDRLARRQAELLEAVNAFDVGRLDDPVNPENKGDVDGATSYRALLSGIAQHSAYHAGQIVLLRKALK